MPLLGVVYVVAYTNTLPPLFNFFYSNQRGGGGGHGRLCPLAMLVTVVQPGFVNGEPK